MIRIKPMYVLAAALLGAGCTQTAGTPAPVVTGPKDADSVTVFTLALQRDSVTDCILGDSGMDRPVTLTIRNDSAVLLTSGGIHYGLDRVAANVYAGGDYIKIKADVSVRPKRLAVSTNDGACNWAATAP